MTHSRKWYPSKTRKVLTLKPTMLQQIVEYLQENEEDIDSLIVIMTDKDNGVNAIYNCNSYLEAAGMLEVAKDTLHEIASSGDFQPKAPKGE